MVYTIGIKRKFLPGYKKYRVTGHRTQFDLNGAQLVAPRMILSCENGEEVAICDILHRDFKVYADFKEARRKAEEQEAEENHRRELQEQRVLFDHFLEEQKKIRAVPPPAVAKEA